MPTIRSSFRKFTIPEIGGIKSIPISENVDIYVIQGTTVLQNDYEIEASGTPIEGTQYDFWYQGDIDLNGNEFIVFGKSISQGMLDTANMISCWYNDSAWQVFVYRDEVKMPEERTGVGETELVLAGHVIEYVGGSDFDYQVISGTGTLTGNVLVGSTEGISSGSHFIIRYEATVSLNGNTISIFGESLSELEAQSGEVTVMAYYDGTIWHTTRISPFQNTSPAINYAKRVTLQIEGNGIDSEFALTHNLGNEYPSFSVWDETNKTIIITTDQTVDQNTVKIIFDDPPLEGEVFSVTFVG